MSASTLDASARAPAHAAEVLWERDHTGGIVTARGGAPQVHVTLANHAVGSPALKPAHLRGLARCAAIIARHVRSPDGLRRWIVVEGHASASGSSARNVALSRRRAEVAAAALGELVRNLVRSRLGPGAASLAAQVQRRIAVRWKGSADRARRGTSPATLARNRRVEIRIF